jgi:glycogen synthase
MRLLITTDTVGGVWNYTSTLARTLADEGHAVLLAVIGDPTDEQMTLLPENVAIEVRRYRLEWMPDSSVDLGTTARWLAQLARSWRSDVIHLNQMAYPGIVPFQVPTVVVVHSDVSSWFSEVRGFPPTAEWGEYVRVVQAGLAAADVVVAPSQYQADLVCRHYGQRRIRVIHNATEIPAQEPELRSEPSILTVGRAWDPAKGIATVDRALELFGDDAPPAHLLGAVEGPGAVAGQTGRLLRHGAVSRVEVERWMNQTTIYVAASLYEPFGLAVLEAAARGCTLVLSDIGSFRELWDGCATFFPKNDSEQLAVQLRAVLQDREHARALGAAARARARKDFSVERFAADYLSVYSGFPRPTAIPIPALPSL